MLRVPNEVLPGQVVTAADMSASLRYVKSHTLRPGPGTLTSTGSGGTTQRKIVRPWKRQWPAAVSGGIAPWPFKLYQVISGSNAYVRVNGGDGVVASLEPEAASPDGIALVNGTRNDTETGSPPSYPLLAITGNGDIYVQATLNALGQATAVNVYFGTMPSADTASPPGYGVKRLGTVTGFSAGMSPSFIPSFTLADANGPVGLTTIGVCGNAVTIS